MGQIRHGCASTTHAVRAAIQRSQASTAELSRELGINPKTVAKWRKRATVSETPASSILHRCVEDRQRSTMLSLRSLIQQLGAALGLILAGAVADMHSTPVAWVVGAAFLFIAVILALMLVRRLALDADN